MWFKNLNLYQFKQPLAWDEQWLDEMVEARKFTDCGPMQAHSTGWAPPLGRTSDVLVHRADGFAMLRQRTEDKLLPPKVVNEALAEKIAQLEEPPGRRQRNELKGQILDELMPKAFSVYRDLYAYIDMAGGWLVIDASSQARAESFCTLLRETLGSLPIAPLSGNMKPSLLMTEWVRAGTPPEGWAIDQECDLEAPQREGGVVRCRRQHLDTEEILTHLKAGKEVTKLALSWKDRMSFTLTSDLDVRKLKFLDMVQDQAREIETNDDRDRFDADFSIMTLELRGLFDDITKVFNAE